jgi:hypothetical protein
LLIGKVSSKFLENLLAVAHQYFGLTFVIVTNATNYAILINKITIPRNNYYYKVVFIFLTVLLLSLAILTSTAHATNTPIYKSETSKKHSLYGAMINSSAANPLIRNSTTAPTYSVIASHNLTTTLVATTISHVHTLSNAPALLRGSLSPILTKSNVRNSLFVKTRSPDLIMDSNHHSDLSKSKSSVTSAFKNVIHNALGSKDKITKIAFITPSFTAAAYSNSFYVFYSLYQNLPPGKNVTADIHLLTSKVIDKKIGSAASRGMLYLYKNIESLIPKSKIDILTDADVDAGDIFAAKNGFNKYNILVIGHQEYVTQQEYDNLKHFVSSGGTMIILDGNVFYAEVKYNRNTHTVTLVKGHGWAFNGKSAWKSVSERWKEETSQWIGSNYLCFRCGITFSHNPFGYKQHEEQYITNSHDVILFNFGASMPIHNHNNQSQVILAPSRLLVDRKAQVPVDRKHIIATYELRYQKGKVIALGIYADDIITNNKFDKYIDGLLLRYVN